MTSKKKKREKSFSLLSSKFIFMIPGKYAITSSRAIFLVNLNIGDVFSNFNLSLKFSIV